MMMSDTGNQTSTYKTAAFHYGGDGKLELIQVRRTPSERVRLNAVRQRRTYIVSRTRYNPDEQTTDYRFTGQRWQGDIGLYYYGARWYDHLIGRFAQADSIVPKPGNPQSLNRYSYVLNNPLRYTDPSGNAECAAGDQGCWVREWGWKNRWYQEHGYENAGNDSYVYTGNFVIPNAGALLGDDHQRRMMIKNFAVDLASNHTAAGEALARVTAYAAAFYKSVAPFTPLLVPQYVDDVSNVLTGMAGFDILLDLKNRRENVNPYFVGQNRFPDTDLRAIFEDSTANQPYHFWFYVAVTVQNGPLVAQVGNLLHELWPVPVGRSFEDFALGAMGSDLGQRLRSRQLDIFAVSSWIRSNLVQ